MADATKIGVADATKMGVANARVANATQPDKWRVHHLGEKGQVCSGSDSWRFATYSLSFQLRLKVEYKTHDGKKKKSKLLTSGFWGLARHLNYVFELLLALSWRY